MKPGSMCRVFASDLLDPMSQEWNGRIVQVVSQVHGAVFEYWRCVDLNNGHKGTFRAVDLVPIKEKNEKHSRL